jgi:hypothetical protein
MEEGKIMAAEQLHQQQLEIKLIKHRGIQIPYVLDVLITPGEYAAFLIRTKVNRANGEVHDGLGITYVPLFVPEQERGALLADFYCRIPGSMQVDAHIQPIIINFDLHTPKKRDGSKRTIRISTEAAPNDRELLQNIFRNAGFSF